MESQTQKWFTRGNRTGGWLHTRGNLIDKSYISVFAVRVTWDIVRHLVELNLFNPFNDKVVLKRLNKFNSV